MKGRGRTLGALMAALILLSSLVVAEGAPGLINYQGRLTDDAGQPITGSLSMSFSLFDGETGGSPLWTEQKGVEVSAGIFSVLLGDSVPVPASVFSGSTVYLEMAVMSETLSPRARLTSVPYALQAASANTCSDADLFDGLDSLDFAPASHQHAGDEISSGEISVNYYSAISDLGAEGYLDNDSGADLLTQDQLDARFANSEGNDSMTGSLGVGGDLTVSGGNIGLGMAANANYGITNNSGSPSPTGAYFWGSGEGLRAAWSTAPGQNFTILAQSDKGVETYVGSSGAAGNRYGVKSQATSSGIVFGIDSQARGYGSSASYGISSYGHNYSTGAAYGGWFVASNEGTGSHYGVYAAAYSVTGKNAFGVVGYADGPGNNYAGYFMGGRVRVGSSGTENYVDGAGDLYVQDELEVDGTAYFSGGIDAPGAIDPSDVSFNYAGSLAKGGAANDSDLLDGQHGTYYMNASNINSGTLGVSYYSAYADLSAEGYLDNSGAGDLFTMDADGDLTVPGGNIGVGTTADDTIGIVNDSVAPPTYGAKFYGSLRECSGTGARTRPTITGCWAANITRFMERAGHRTRPVTGTAAGSRPRPRALPSAWRALPADRA